jgi:hypothetical protein
VNHSPTLCPNYHEARAKVLGLWPWVLGLRAGVFPSPKTEDPRPSLPIDAPAAKIGSIDMAAISCASGATERPFCPTGRAGQGSGREKTQKPRGAFAIGGACKHTSGRQIPVGPAGKMHRRMSSSGRSTRPRGARFKTPCDSARSTLLKTPKPRGAFTWLSHADRSDRSVRSVRSVQFLRRGGGLIEASPRRGRTLPLAVTSAAPARVKIPRWQCNTPINRKEAGCSKAGSIRRRRGSVKTANAAAGFFKKRSWESKDPSPKTKARPRAPERHKVKREDCVSSVPHPEPRSHDNPQNSKIT